MQFLIATALLTFSSFLASAQVIDPNTVPIGTRNTWCTNQQASCPILCTQIGASNAPTSNTCDANSLAWTCICDNGMQPNASAFSQTIPFYECQESNNQCAGRCNGDNNCVSSCYSAHPCGAQDPPHVNASTSTSTSMGMSATGAAASGASDATSSFGADSTGFAGASSTPSSSASHMLLLPRAAGAAETCGLVALLSLVAGFAFLL